MNLVPEVERPRFQSSEDPVYLFETEIPGENPLAVYAFKKIPLGSVCTLLVSKSNPNERIVAVDKHFFKMTRVTQTVMLLHEVGHVLHKHYSGIRSFEEELEADKHAVKELGVEAMIVACKEWVKYVERHSFLEGSREEAVRKLKYWETKK